ncbi:hypothetical protein [Chondromyces crocatus]|uniref:hypothetical protein n=1 Tax=Chondromyces crocatus TaxID=52 RepID=UPI0012E0C831|nr:hypothetical protein [Chondromyces crocatus]
MDLEIASAFAAEEFERLHPRGTWPKWIGKSTTISGCRDKQKGWIVSFSVAYKEPLLEGEQWEQINGNWQVVTTDPKTLKKMVVFRSPRRTEVYFKVLVHHETGAVTVIVDRDLSDFDGDDLEGERGPSG